MPKSEPIPPAWHEANTAPEPRYRVLLVEDDHFDQMAFRQFVREAGLSHGCAVVCDYLVEDARETPCRLTPG